METRGDDVRTVSLDDEGRGASNPLDELRTSNSTWNGKDTLPREC
jgi:hypothetical protein